MEQLEFKQLRTLAITHTLSHLIDEIRLAASSCWLYPKKAIVSLYFFLAIDNAKLWSRSVVLAKCQHRIKPSRAKLDSHRANTL